jgi:hypothetical protein
MRAKTNIMKKWTTPDKLTEISEWAGIGFSDKDLAERMGISVRSFYRYRSECPELDEAIRSGKELVDRKVESALLRAALGGKVRELKVTSVYGKDGQLVSTVKERITRELPPNVLACQTWLFNRKRDEWKRNPDNAVTVDDDKSINITITRAGKAKNDESESD